MNEDLLKIINTRQLVSVMNKTKWRELCEDFEIIQNLNIKVRYKLITTDQMFGLVQFGGTNCSKIHRLSNA